jgi:hypothetical protein
MANILIIGEDPDTPEFADMAPPGVTVTSVHRGLDDAAARLEGEGHAAAIMLTGPIEAISGQLAEALAARVYDVIVIGAGLRSLPPMTEKFETLINEIRNQAPRARLAFNTSPNDSDVAARRQV